MHMVGGQASLAKETISKQSYAERAAKANFSRYHQVNWVPMQMKLVVNECL